MTIRFDSLGLALGTVALICLGCGEPVAPPTVSEEVAAEIQKEEKAAEEAANQAPEEEYELKEAGVGATGKGNYGVTSEEAASIITVPISTYFHAQEKAVFDIQIPQALSLFQASEGRGHSDYSSQTPGRRFLCLRRSVSHAHDSYKEKIAFAIRSCNRSILR